MPGEGGAIGFIGLGTMGGPMAGHLLEAGRQVVVWNRSPTRMTPLVAAGAEAATDPADVASRSAIVMLCVSDTPDVTEVVTGPSGVLDGLAARSIVVDHSTISPAETRRLADLAATAGGSWVDAPVSGGSEGAVHGRLSVMVGADPEDYATVQPVMEAYATTVTHVGPVGSGQLVKLVNQVLVVVNQLAASEALLLAQAAGLDLERTLAAVGGGAASSWMLANRGPQMIHRDWRPGFTIDLQQKDLRLALEAAESLGVPLPTTALVHQLYRTLQHRGLGGEGNHALVKALEALAGIELGPVWPEAGVDRYGATT
jgi:3-hydroxyisobutyrate dehydrogenase